jgi:hypothetical protein
MAELERPSKNKQEEEDHKHRVRQPEAEASFDRFLAYGQGTSPVTETPFRPQVDQHAALLAAAQSNERRANLAIHLQQTYGNRYVQRLLNSMAVQAKLTVNAPNDIYEQEADSIADTVTMALATQAQRQEEEEEEEEEEPVQAKSFLQRQVEEEEEEEEEELQAKAADYVQRTTANAVPEISSEMESEINAARGGGQPLAEETRQPMEQAFGTDFSGVRVHTDESADTLNQSLQAEAFTRGQDIFFKSGAYNPESTKGQKLLAHELTHTIQQDAHKRIAPWAPTGHRIITDKALEEDPLKSRYSQKAKDILIVRSADMDFIQDQQDKMGTGMAESKTNVKKYKEDAEKLKGLEEELGTATEGPEKNKIKVERDALKTSLDNMWRNNELHIRDENYMRMHGEGGLYRTERGAAASVNKDVTKLMINTAADLYDSGNNTKAVEVLSDALHQAEDRGSHYEGEQGKGHDARQKIKMGNRVPEHRGEFDGVPRIPDEEPYPDNSDKNNEGAKLAIGYAYNVLSTFINKVKSKEPITAEEPKRRHAKIAGFETTSTGKATKYWEAHFKAGKTGKYLGKLGEKDWRQPAISMEYLEQRLAERREQMGYEVTVSPEAEDALKYYIESMTKQGIRDIVRNKPDWYIRKKKDKYLAQLLKKWPPKYHDEVKKHAEAQLANY